MNTYSPEEERAVNPRVETVFLENEVLDPYFSHKQAEILIEKEKRYKRMLGKAEYFLNEGESLVRGEVSGNDERKKNWLLEFHPGRFGKGRVQDIEERNYSAPELHSIVRGVYASGKKEAMDRYYQTKGRLKIVKQLQGEKIEED